MSKEIEWYRTLADAGLVYRAIRWDREKSKYVLISGGDTDVTKIEFDNPKILADAIVSLGANREVFIQAEGTVTDPEEVRTGQVNLALKAEHGALAAFESTIQIHVK
jgi:hypothetical protein